MKISLKEFMQTEKFKNLPTVNNCHFGNAGSWTDVYPYMIISATESKKTIRAIELDWKVVNGSMGDGSAEYEFYINLIDGEFESQGEEFILCRGKRYKNNTRMYQQKGCKCLKLCVVEFPRKYEDPSF